jgi:hypothetical protein
MPYTAPTVITERVGQGGTPLGNTSFFIPTVIAKSLGTNVTISRTAVATSDGTAYASINGIVVSAGDTLNYEKLTYSSSTKLTTALSILTGMRGLVSVSTTSTDPYKKEYLEDIDFTFSSTTGILDFSAAPALLAPEFDNPIQIASGGSITAGNYQFALTALDANGNQTIATQYSSGGTTSYNVASSSSTVTIRWGKVPNASGYKLYAKPASGSTTDWARIQTITDGTVSSIALTTAISAGALTLSATNATMHTPANSALVFVAYNYSGYNYNSPKRYFDTNTIQIDHGIGSEASNAARLVMGPAGVGSANSSMYLVAPEVSNGEIVGFQDAISACESIQDLILMATTSSSDLVNQTLIAHCNSMSSTANAKDRFGFVSTTSAVLSDSDVNKVINKIKAFNGSNRCVFVVTDGGKPYINSWQNTTDNVCVIDNSTQTSGYTLNQAVDGQWHAIATMGMVCALPDPAEPPTLKQVYGISSGVAGTVKLWLNARKDAIGANGGLVLEDQFNNLYVRHALTVSQASVEDSELSIVLAEAYMARRLRDANRKYVGKKNIDTVRSAIKFTTKEVLDELIGVPIINSLKGDVTVYQDTTRPTWVIISFSYKPVYPINVLDFQWGFDLVGA